MLTDFDWKKFSLMMLEEDCADRDVTTEILIDPERKAVALIFAESDCVICGLKAAYYCFKLLDESIEFSPYFKDGDKVVAGTVVAKVEGRGSSILSAERSALNALYHLSGIATWTRKFVEKASQLGIEVYDTRKTRPLLRKVEKFAVFVGGAKNHRENLSQAIFIKDNHKKIAGGLENIVKTLKLALTEGGKPRIIVEVESLEEIEAIIDLKPDVVLLDNFEIEQLRVAFEKYGDRLTLEVSGGVDFDNLEELARVGVKRVSTSSLILKAEPKPFKLEVEEVI